MSQVICTISGQPTDTPVVSPKSGAVFDRSLITKYLEEYGRDPTNEVELRVDEVCLFFLEKVNPYNLFYFS